MGFGGDGLHRLNRHTDTVGGASDGVEDSGENQYGAQIQVSD